MPGTLIILRIGFLAAIRLQSGCNQAAIRLQSGCNPAAIRLQSGCNPADDLIKH